jgi:hypothetical protein
MEEVHWHWDDGRTKSIYLSRVDVCHLDVPIINVDRVAIGK